MIFYLFFLLIGLSALGVVLSRNSIYSIFFLILVFLFTSCLFFFLGAEFFSYVFVIVYVGAIAILFLFIVMMLNVKINEITSLDYNYIPLGVFLIVFFLYEITYFFDFSVYVYNEDGQLCRLVINNIKEFNIITGDLNEKSIVFDWVEYVEGYTDLQMLGFVLYDWYFFSFFLVSVILFVATLGSISLTINNKTGVVKAQDFSIQYRSRYINRVYFFK